MRLSAPGAETDSPSIAALDEILPAARALPAMVDRIWPTPPYLRPHTIAKRMEVSSRSVQRSLSRLRKKGLLRQIRKCQDDGTMHYYHDRLP